MTSQFHVRFTRGDHSFTAFYPTAMDRALAMIMYGSLGYTVAHQWGGEADSWPRIAEDDDLTPDGRYMS